ncbi:hypothetical protein MN116_002048 [Schistosoma mekongi]|uniref:SP-RING-type domain-containing protein n=1 Tax=Schistosoma mekongi TaxID=38744 RepID=A0AAE1ZJU1_SCHME|nr:hypothetical protein MN116_002048 [Schistosoma mekongi]
MRPACAYPPIIQTNITNGPDLYRERDVFSYGVANSQPLPVQPMGSNPAMYHGSVSASGFNCPNSTMSPQPQMPLQQSHFQLQQYSQMHPSYGDMIGSSQISSFQTQQQQYPTVLMNSNLDKLASQNLSTSESPSNLNYIRNHNVANGSALPHSQIMSNTTLSSYGLPSPNCSPMGSHQQRTSLISMGTQNTVNRNIPQTQQVPNRSSAANRTIVSSESASFPQSSMYLPYSSECSVSQPGSGIAAPYSVTMSTCNTVPQVTNNSMAPGLVCSGQSPRPPASCRSQISSNAPSSAPAMQQQMYSSQQTRPLNNSGVYSCSGYVNQQYTQPSLAFRPSPNAMNSQTATSVVTRSTTPRDAQGNNCLTMHHTLSQQQSQQPSISLCSSNSSPIVGPGSTQPGIKSAGGCNINCGTTSIYNHPCTPTGHSIQNAMGSNQMVAPNPSTPPCVMPIASSRGVGSHVNPSVGDLCYLPSRSISSGGREVVMTTVSIGGGNGGSLPSSNEMMLNSNFHITSGLNPSTSTSFSGNNSQIPGLPNDFDASVSNSSPLMMMTMPVSSPIPGNLINGPIPGNVMTMAMVSSTPAPPPYHQPASMMPCRSVGSSFFSPTSMSMPSITVTSAVHLNAIPTFSTVPDLGNVNNSSDRGMYGIMGDNIVGSSVNSKQVSGTNKTRPKRVRGSKTSSGVGRGSRINSKKNLTSSTIPSVSSTESFSPSQRVINQQPRKPQSWNTGSAGNVNFNSAMISPTQSIGMPMLNSGFISGMDNRESPVTFATQSNSATMRPNSGPPANNLNISTNGIPYNESSNSLDVQSNPNMRLPVSPRHSYCSSQMPMQQQYPIPNTSGNSCTYTSGHGSNVFYNQVNQHVLNMNTPQQTLTSNGNQMCYPNNGPLSNNNSTQRTPPSAVQYQSHTLQPNSHIQNISSPMTSNCNRISTQPNPNIQNYPPPIPIAAGAYTYTDRLVCPITNGMVWGPTQMQLNDVMHQYLPDGIYVRRFEFDLTANHLSTIVGRSDLDIVVCSHLLSEPLQVCHWPPDAVQIRFNDYLLRLDRSSVNGGQPAHKVACVKQLCRPGRNQLEIAILGLGEDPNQPSTMAKRRATAQTLEAHRFAAFMAHMPALNVLLDGLQRRRPAGVNTLCDILEGRIGTRNSSEDGSSTQNVLSGSSQTPVVAELNLICPVFRTRMRIPGRIAGCQHVEAFDMEAFLRREVLWPRLNCPICGHKSPAGLDGLCIDTTILYALQLVPQSAESILVRSDGYWRLVPPLCLDLPVDVDQWQPLVGPLTELVSQAFSHISTKVPLRVQASGNIGVRQIPTQCHPNVSQPTVTDWNRSPLQRISPQQQQLPQKVTSTRKSQQLHPTSQTTKVVTCQSDIIGSPQWMVSDSCSPNNQTNPENTCSNVSCGPSELVDSAYSSVASRPSSQPISWIGAQSSPDKVSTSTSLPSSPSISTRPVSCFSMAAIPGVNMCSVDSLSSASNLSLTTTTSTCTTTTTAVTLNKSFLATCVSSDLSKGGGATAEKRIDVAGSDNSCHIPITVISTTTTTTLTGFSTDEVSSECGISVSGNNEHISPSNVNLESSGNLASSNKKCPTSSLNMGLDFLLTEDQAITSTAIGSGEGSPQMSSAVVSAAVRSLLTSGCDTVSSISPVASTSTTNSEELSFITTKCTYNSFSEQSTSPSKCECIPFKCEQPPNGCADALISDSYPNNEEKYNVNNQSGDFTSIVENDMKTTLDGSNEDTSLVLCEMSMPIKRMKLESPQISPQISLHTHVIEQQIVNPPDKYENDIVSTKQSTINSVTTALNDELLEVEKVISGHSDDNDSCYPGYVGLVNNDFDDGKLSIELIHSVSSKIDHLDLFLDESYIRFVEHFPCV